MSARFFNLSIAMHALSAHKLRTVLAMLGVFLGALAFTSVQHISLAMVRSAEVEVEKLGPNLFAIIAGEVRFTKRGGTRWRDMAHNFRTTDAQAVIDGVPSVVDGTPFSFATLPIRANGTTTTFQMVAAQPNYPELRSMFPASGRFYTTKEYDERAKVCVLGNTIAERLFTTPEDAVGEYVRIFRAEFKVIGVMEKKGRDLSGADQDEQVFMPLTTYMRRASNVDWIYGVYLRTADGADMAQVRSAATAILRERHKLDEGEPDDFSLLDARDTMQLKDQALQLVHTLGVITSSVSFAVGGLGILSIMVLIVRSRRVEIGIRRAVGCTRADIVRQFLFEAGLMSGAGGAAGVVVSIGLVALVCHFGKMPFLLSPVLLVGTLAGSVALGVLAGAYPAWQAARVEILEVLRD
ncbi:MAG: ABC transporter permease [Desulfovibrio sp.]